MLENTRRARMVLAGVAGVNLALALAVGAGAVTRPGADSGARSAEQVASAAFAQDSVASARQPGDTSRASVQAAAAATAPTVTAAPTTDARKVIATTAAPTTKAPVAAAIANATTAAAPARAAAAAVPPAASQALPVVVARVVPPASQVQQAISNLPSHVHSILTPSAAQVAQLGDKVCTMFDQGQSFAQVKATGLQMVTQVPLTTVLPGGADWVVRTVVTLYCPGHLPKLV